MLTEDDRTSSNRVVLDDMVVPQLIIFFMKFGHDRL